MTEIKPPDSPVLRKVGLTHSRARLNQWQNASKRRRQEVVQKWLDPMFKPEPQFKIIRLDGITVAEGWQCPKCGVITARKYHCTEPQLAQLMTDQAERDNTVRHKKWRWWDDEAKIEFDE